MVIIDKFIVLLKFKKVDDTIAGTINKIKTIIVTIDKFIVLLKVKKVDDTIAGTINKIVKGFVTPPVKYNNTDNWRRS